MCYRCEICQEVSKPGEPQKLHPIQRSVPRREACHRRIDMNGIMRTISVETPPRLEIAREIKCCKPCYSLLQVAPLSIVMRQRGRLLPTKVVKKKQQETLPQAYDRVVKQMGLLVPPQSNIPLYKPVALTPVQVKASLIEKFKAKAKAQPLAKSTTAYASAKALPPAKPTVCDHCGGKVGKDAQWTAHSIMCKSCINNAKRGTK